MLLVCAGHHREQARLPAELVALGALPGFHGGVDHREKLGARALQRIHRAGLDQAFDHAAIDGAKVDALAEVVDRCERAVLIARRDDGFDGACADILDRAQSEADCIAVGREVLVRFIHIRRQHLHAHVAAFVHVLHDFGRVARFPT